MKSFLRGGNFVFLLVGLVSCQTPPPGGQPPPTSSSNNSCAQYMNCVSGVAGSVVTFDRSSGNDTVLINMTTRAVNGSGWMAVGFSYNNQMDNDSVIDCILLQDGRIIVKNSYNMPNDKMNTDIPDPYLGIQVVNTSYANGVLQCILRRAITVVSSSNKIFSLTQPYYILIATGLVDNTGSKIYHGSTNRYVSSKAVDVTSDFLVPRDRRYFLDTLGNFVTFAYIPSSGEMEFEIQGPVNKTGRWISLGLSNDMYMGEDSVLDCLLLTNNSVVVQNSFNVPGYKSNQPLNSAEGITVIKTSNINGWLYCAFRRKIANFSSNSWIYPLDKSYYLLLGDGNLNADGTKLKHGHTPVVSASAVDIRTVSGNVSRSDQVSPAVSPTFASSYACMQPMNCVSFDVNSAVTFNYQPGDTQILINMTTKAVNGSGWMGLGFSYDNMMGDDSVIDCILTKNGAVVVKNSYNVPAPRGNEDIPDAPQLGIQIINTSYANGVLQCILRRSITVVSSNNKVFNLNQPYYILIATGPIDDQGKKQYHGNTSRNVSSNAVNVASDFLVPRDRHYFLDTLGNSVTFAYIPSYSSPNSQMGSDSGEMEFEIQGPVSKTGRWISLGLSNDVSMGEDSVLDCLLLSNNSVVVQNSFNVPNYKNNQPLNSAEGITVIKTSNINGRLYCAFRRKIANFSNSQIYPLDKPYYLLLGDGNLNADGTKQMHGHTPVVSASAVDVRTVSGNVSRSGEILSSPPPTAVPMSLQPVTANPGYSVFTNDQSGDKVMYRLSDDGSSVEFIISSQPQGPDSWIGVGFSYDPRMRDDSVIDCIHLQNGNFIIQNSYNNLDGGNDVVNTDGIKTLQTNYSDSKFSCQLTRSILSNNSRIFPFNRTYYLLLASGNSSSSGQKTYHTPNRRTWSSEMVNLTSYQPNILSTPPATVPMSFPTVTASPGYSVFSNDKSGDRVMYKLSNDSNSVEFIISGQPQGPDSWIGVGFSYDQQMKDDSVIDCIHLQNGSFIVQNSYNNLDGGNDIVNADGIQKLQTDYSDSKMSCRLTRSISSNNSRIFPFNQTYYLLLASGTLSPSGQKTYHGNSRRIASSAMVNLTAYDPNIGSSQNDQLLRAHGCLMITAFVMLMSGAILIARYYKTCWPEDKLCNTAVWFAVHRFIMVTGLFCCAAGFIIIFCYSKGKLTRTFGDSPSYFWAHGPMGIAVMILIAMNPLIALFRCDPDHDRRWIFNWLHWFVGTCCQVLAGITLFFGIKMGESDNYKLNHFSVFWILIAFVGFHVLIELLLLLEKCISDRHDKRRFTVTYGMSSPGEPASAVKQAGDVSRESLLFRYFILAMYVLITMGLWLAMIILIGGGFQMGNK